MCSLWHKLYSGLTEGSGCIMSVAMGGGLVFAAGSACITCVFTPLLLLQAMRFLGKNGAVSKCVPVNQL